MENTNVSKVSTQERIVWEITTLLRGSTINPIAVNLAAYLLSKSDELPGFAESNLASVLESGVIEERVAFEIKQLIREEDWNSIKQLHCRFPREGFEAAVLFDTLENAGHGYCELSTPKAINGLAAKVLDIRQNETVADVCSGISSFLSYACEEHPDSVYYGYDLYNSCVALAMARSDVLHGRFNVQQCDVFSLVSSSKYLLPEGRFDKIFSHIPFGIRRNSLPNSDGIEYLIEKYPALQKTVAGEWFFAALAAELINKNGKAMLIIPNGLTFNASYQNIRQEFITKGLVESVVYLPGHLLSYTGINVCVLVLSHDNASVRLVDASNIYTPGRRVNTITTEQAAEIVASISDDYAPNGITLTADDLARNEYVLYPGHYLTKEISYPDGVEFGSIIESVTRGEQSSANKLDELASQVPTDFCYLRLADIQDGIISDDLHYLKSIDDNSRKYCLKPGDLIISKNDVPHKIAVVDENEKRTVLANGNLYVITLDKNRVLPYYIKAYLESEEGRAQLEKFTVGTVIKTIGVDKLKQIIIPLPATSVQKEISDKYLAAMDEVKLQRLKLARSLQKMNSLFDSERR